MKLTIEGIIDSNSDPFLLVDGLLDWFKSRDEKFSGTVEWISIREIDHYGMKAYWKTKNGIMINLSDDNG